MTIGPAPKIMIFFKSVRFPTGFRPSPSHARKGAGSASLAGAASDTTHLVVTGQLVLGTWRAADERREELEMISDKNADLESLFVDWEKAGRRLSPDWQGDTLRELATAGMPTNAVAMAAVQRNEIKWGGRPTSGSLISKFLNYSDL